MIKWISKKNICGVVAIAGLVISAVAAIAMGYFYLEEKVFRYIPTKRNLKRMVFRFFTGLFKKK